MNKIEIVKFSRDSLDSKGKDCPIVYHCYVSGRQKSLSRKSLLEAIELTLPEGEPDVDTETPLLERVNGQ